MFRTLAFASVALLCTLALAAPKDDLLAAAKALADADNYTWVTAAESGGFPLAGGPTTGMTQKAGYTTISVSRNSGIGIVLKADKAVLRTPTAWLTPQEVKKLPEAEQRYILALTMTLDALRLPPDHVQHLLANSRTVRKNADGSYSAELTEDAAQTIIASHVSHRRIVPKVLAPAVSVTFQLKDGLLVKYACDLSAILKTDQDERGFDLRLTTTIKDINSTTLTIPPEARQKLD